MAIIEAKEFARALSELHKSKDFLDSNSLIEISRNSGGSYKSYRATLQQLNDAVINYFHLYKNLNEIFDSAEYPDGTYFNKNTTFAFNPYVDDISSFSNLYENQLIVKQNIKDYLEDTGSCVPICKPAAEQDLRDAKYVYYIPDRKIWLTDGVKIPKVISPTKDGIWTSESNLKFNFGSNTYAYTEDVVAPKNMLLNVTGNILLYENYSEQWFEPDNVSFVALTIDGNIITLTLLKNILKIKDDDGNEYIIGQFHFNCPIAKGTTFKIITNAECKLFGVPSENPFTRRLYDTINAVNLSFYDYNL